MTLIQTLRILARPITFTSVPRWTVRVIIMAALVASVSEAAAQQPSQDFSSGNDLFRGCKVLSEGGTADAQLQSAGMFCAGFAFGLASVGRYLSVPGLRSCAPATLTASQLASIIVKYAEAQPERMREDARQVTLEAFHDAWPCSN
jgi:Rap1a immunity proteins